MQKTVEYIVDNKVSPATLELIIRERSKSKSLRQLGQMFGISQERVRQLLAKYGPSQVALLPEARVAAKLRYPLEWLIRLRKDGFINPIRRGFWLYSEEQIRQIPSIIVETRKCQHAASRAHLALISSAGMQPV